MESSDYFWGMVSMNGTRGRPLNQVVYSSMHVLDLGMAGSNQQGILNAMLWVLFWTQTCTPTIVGRRANVEPIVALRDGVGKEKLNSRILRDLPVLLSRSSMARATITTTVGSADGSGAHHVAHHISPVEAPPPDRE